MEIHQYEFVDTLIQEMKYMRSMNQFNWDNNNSISLFPDQTPSNEFKIDNPISDSPELGMLPIDPKPWVLTSEVDQSTDETDFQDDILKYIGQMLMEEEDLEHKPCMFQECSALQAAEKSFYDVLGEKYPPSLNDHCPTEKFSSPSSSGESSNGSTSIEPDTFPDQSNFNSSFTQPPPTDNDLDSVLLPFGLSNTFSDSVDGGLDYLLSSVQAPDSSIGVQQNFPHSHFRNSDPQLNHSLPYEVNEFHDLKVTTEADQNGRYHSSNETRGKKNHYREDGDFLEGGRSTKQLASYTEESDEQFDLNDVLLCPGLRSLTLQQESMLCPNEDALHVGSTSMVQQNGQSKGRSNRGRPRGKRQASKKEVVDLRTLLTQCAQAVSSYDSRTANELLKRIKQHSSAYGDGTERLAHYFANALEARLAGTGTALYAASASKRVSAADGLKGYQVYVKASPFSKMSNFFANRSIGRLTQNATRLHIIDFGILYGFQWPCLIQHLSIRPGGPPNLRITGIDFPQPGFRPAARVEETGRRLAKCCQKFGVPFQYDAIAKKWETIQLQDLKIEADELLVVNCLYRLKNVPDDTVVAVSSPRDEVLNLVHRINPDLFVHGVVNGTYNAPFFATRFREAVFHFSALFDMFEAAASREDEYRKLFEKEVFGRDIMNVIACEGTERVERPETYKQWQVRNIRAGFRQLPLDKDTVEGARSRVRNGYNKDFVVDEASNWMLLGWRGRIVHAISCWKPVQES